MQRFLKTAAKRLLELRPELKADYQRTVDYVPVAESLKLIALEHAVNEEQLKLAENAKRQMKAFGELNQENVLMRVVQFELADIFKEEYAALSGLERASSAIMEQYQERDQRQMSELEDLGQQVAEAFHIKSEDGQRVNILEKDSPFAYLGKKEELEKYHAQVQEVMERSHCTKKEAERRVIEDRRTILQQEALRKTRQGSVVKNITAELQKTEPAFEKLWKLSSLAHGQSGEGGKYSFSRYVLGAFFEEVIDQANYHLNHMTGGKYELIRQLEAERKNESAGLGMVIFDAYTGEKRDTASLSGGESFQVSLSLALGLSDVVRSHSGGYTLDTMFIDEGFGSLDEQSLDQAMRVLHELSGDSRQIGIISHVGKLSENISQKIYVKRSPKGSKVEILV